ncbi:antibiotic biosynthesis monooxygenase [Nesterenkonia salmonea]|uniref:Antibiotic biosynthesis monooxygenase n=1 Tax=Nesterenkonia salmonea TaxID=1804987 RepID=A0A5R9BAC7_9MICC|nr:putative quinol monooxygenase [Nesterenkonia salmonea]TLP96781.1 antibiotic biosynthesis monooxygenase [Nesterenkonia salmonea]
MTVVVTAVFQPKEGKKAELVEAMRRGIEAVHQEDGCELYAIHDAEDGTVTMLEKWTSVEALDTHGEGEPVRQLLADITDLIDGVPVVTRMTPIPMGADKQGAL